MLHNLLHRLETLQEEMNNIREELVDTLKESFDLETLKLDEEQVKPYADDSEEEEA
jgi:adenine C2-methylase RlmN of 23S rRNA A2503 and tRNA A37